MSLQTIYVGRLDEEKGIGQLIRAMKLLLGSHRDISLHIYGTGTYTKDIQELSKEYPNNIFYYGWQKKNTILAQRRQMDYFIMPSQFLETFGLTACESLLCHVPVIGNKKGGLLPFIHDMLDIGNYTGNDDTERLYNLIENLIDKKIDKAFFSDLIQHTKTTYSKQSRYRQVKVFLPLKKEILLVNDYINYNGGGIETHIHDSMAILKNHDHIVTLYGHNPPHGKFKLLFKFFIMALSIINIPDALVLKYFARENKGILWRHSISRVIGWLPVALSDNKNQIITYHELGLFHPYPSKTNEILQIPKARSLSSFLDAGNPSSILQKISIIGKYGLVRLIHKQLKRKVKTHIVPSERMIDMVKNRHPDAHIVCIPHFVDLEIDRE